MSTHANNSSRVYALDHTLSWTDDLPVCHLSGVGFATNQIYREDGFRHEGHEFEDRSFHFKVDDVFLYGVFDGHDGCKSSNFAAQRMPAEILLGQLTGKMEDDLEVKDVLHQAFISVDRGYFDSIDDALATKANIQLHIPEGMNMDELRVQLPDLYKRLELVESEISSGTTAVLALYFNNKLFTAHIGSCRALLCKKDNSGVLRVVQLTVDHDLDNAEEVEYLSSLGLDIDLVKQEGSLGRHNYTRTIGDYYMKGGYKDNDLLRHCSEEPVHPEPEVQGGIQVDDSCAFLILMSNSVYRSLEAATGTEHVNAKIASMVASEFAVQTTLNGVAQAVVDKVVRSHHDAFMTSADHRKDLCRKRDDMTLLIRNFSYPLPNALSSPTAGGRYNPVSIPYYQGRADGPPALSIVHNDPVALSLLSNRYTLTANTQASILTGSNTYNSDEDSTQSGSGDARPFVRKTQPRSTLELDENGYIEPYISFSDFYEAVEKLTESEKALLDINSGTCETIDEDTGELNEEAIVETQLDKVIFSEEPTSLDSEPDLYSES